MLRLVLRRLLASIPLMLGVLTLTFVLVEAAPGDPTALLLGDRPVPPEVRERIEAAYGLDRPAAERYLRWLGALVLRGELGWSVSRSRPVARVLAETLPNTVFLGVAAILLHVTAGLGLGVVGARWRGRWPDRTLSSASLFLYAMPTFWVALMAILLFSYRVPIFPPAFASSPGIVEAAWPVRLADRLWHLALPAAVLGLCSAAGMGRFVRSDLSRALAEGFTRGARARGAAGSRVLFRHALRHAAAPAIHLIGLSLPIVVSGSLVVEVVFAWPGIGRLAYDAILARDVPVVLSTTWLATALVVSGSLLADVAHAWIDPRVRAVSVEETA